ncbi:MAG: glycosyltransferase family 39 protein [Pseudorhodobacter sp.]|nr:glycosyltransferase family 39 protein [Rhizobacter sp.]
MQAILNSFWWKPSRAGTTSLEVSQAWRWIVLLCVAQTLLWGLGLGLSRSAPELDSAEQFVWAFSMESGYWKHPPLPSWIMHGLLIVFGPSVALPFVATQLCVTLALALTWKLGCEFMSPRRSLIAMALTSLVAYHNVGGDSFNHNTVLLPFQAATWLFFYRATRSGAWHQWVLVGLFAGLSMLVKYVALLPLAGLLVCFAIDRQLHNRRKLAGLGLAMGVFAAVMLPHALWLNSTSYLPFHYAQAVSQSLPGMLATLRALLDFVLIQAVRLLPFALGLWFVLRQTAKPKPQGAANAHDAFKTSPRDIRFLLIATVTPLLLTVLISLATQTELQSRWGANAFLLVGWLAMAALPRLDTPRMQRLTLRMVLLAQVLMCSVVVLSKTVLSDHLQIRSRANFPGAVLAQKAQATWAQHTSAPLRLVVSDIWLGGNMVAHSDAHKNRRLAVLIDGRHFKSPWVKEQAVLDCGALVLDDQTDDAAGHAQPDAALEALMAKATSKGTWLLPWNGARGDVTRSTQGKVTWGILLPQNPEACLTR